MTTTSAWTDTNAATGEPWGPFTSAVIDAAHTANRNGDHTAESCAACAATVDALDTVIGTPARYRVATISTFDVHIDAALDSADLDQLIRHLEQRTWAAHTFAVEHTTTDASSTYLRVTAAPDLPPEHLDVSESLAHRELHMLLNRAGLPRHPLTTVTRHEGPTT